MNMGLLKSIIFMSRMNESYRVMSRMNDSYQQLGYRDFITCCKEDMSIKASLMCQVTCI